MNISGVSKEYFDLTEVDASTGSVTILDTDDAPPVVATVLTETPSDWEPYEGCLLELQDVTITSAVDAYGQASTSYGDVYSAIRGPLYYSYSEWKVEPEADGYVD